MTNYPLYLLEDSIFPWARLEVSNPWYTRQRKKGVKAFKKVKQDNEPEKAVYAGVQGQSSAGKLPTGYHD
jgi:hypothetical protein